MNIDIRINAYIENAQPFARPILDEIRERVHTICPEVEETLKWKFPHFMYRGKILCSVAAFKNHCSFGFWLASSMDPAHFVSEGMGDFGKMSDLKDLPSKEAFQAMILEAMELIDSRKTAPKAASKKQAEVDVPPEVSATLKQNQQAEINFSKLSPSHQKEYIEWIVDAKTGATKQKRLETMLEWITEGKSRHWKYSRK